MKTLIFLLLSLQCAAQTLTLHEGAGTNPKHFECLGRESGWVEVWIGQMPLNGQILKVWFDNWDEIESIEISLTDLDGNKRAIGLPSKTANERWYGCLSTKVSIAGDWIRWEYKIKLKKA